MNVGPRIWRISREKCWVLDRARVLAIVNVTPDSFSDGGSIGSAEDAASAAARAVEEGADGLDVGGESTRPGAVRVSVEEQIARVVPAIEAIRRRIGDGVAITIDTTLSAVARAGLGAGADAINDVSGGDEDAEMCVLAAERGCGIVLMHRLAPPGKDVFSHEYAEVPGYEEGGGVVAVVEEFLRERAARAEGAGVSRESIVIDPGLGFGKSVEQNLELIAATPRLCAMGYAVMSGVSRKSFVAKAAGMDMGLAPRDRLDASVRMSVRHVGLGAAIVRVHDVAAHVAALAGSSPPKTAYGIQ